MILLIQTNIHGHRAEYIDHVITWAEKNGQSVLVWIKQCELGAAKERFPISKIVRDVRVGEFLGSDLRRFAKKGDVNRLVFLDGDLELAFALRNLWYLRKVSTVFLLMRLNSPSSPRIHSILIYTFKNLISLFLELFPSIQMKRLVFLKKRKHSLLGQVRDPLPKTELPRRLPKKSGTTKYVGIVGTLDERKSIDLAVSAVKALGVGYQLNLVGQATDSFRPELSRLSANFPNVRVKDKFLTEAELSREIASLDCLLVLQRINIPSGTLLRALQAGIPSVVGGANVLRVSGVEFQDSVTWTKLRVGDVAGAIELAANTKPRVVGSIPGPSDFAEDLLE
jgi:glycosyltransferase involved in cell wall biosynthesis